MLHRLPMGALPVCLAVALACTGLMDSRGGPRDYSQGVDGAGPMPLMRLGRVEYVNTIRDLLGVQLPPDAAPSDTLSPTGFKVPGGVSTTEVNRFMSSAEQLGPHIEERLSSLLPCEPTADTEDACARQGIGSFGLRAYRRPLTDEEVEALHGHYARVRADLGHAFRPAMRVVFQTMLQSPNFLYHWQLGPSDPTMDGLVVKLGPYEVASRLSYFLWRSMPDQALFDAAAAGALATPEEVRAQARRMLLDDRARATVAGFHLEWLHITAAVEQKDPAVFPAFDDELRASMERETREFATRVVLDGDGRLETLLLSPVSYINGPLASLYGVAGVSGSDLQEATLDPTQRFGLLTHASVLASHATSNSSSPVQRGLALLEHVLCEPPPPPPPGMELIVPEPDPNLQTREQYVEHSTNEACRGCHQLIDPLGFAFESYDGIGRFRMEEAGRPVDTTGVAFIDGSDVPFTNARDLVQSLVASDAVKRCVAKKWLRFMLYRLETEEEQGSLEEALEAFAASAYDVRELIVAITGTRTFLHRAPANGEVLP
jgi:hypothetical protein